MPEKKFSKALNCPRMISSDFQNFYY